MSVRIRKHNSQIILYSKIVNNIQLYVVRLQSGRITTYWYWNRKRYTEKYKIIHKLKINGCAICGYNKCDRALHFHHTNPKDRKFSIHAANVGHKYLVHEINKCILLCANCHMEIEDKEQQDGNKA